MLKPTFFESIDEIRRLALFYSLYYAWVCLTSMFDAEAPLQVLTCIKNLEKVCNEKWKRPDWFQTIAKAALDKLIFHPLVLFSDKLENSDNMNKFY